MIVFYADPHLGLSRAGNTTPRSSAALQERLFKQAEWVTKHKGYKICMGDMFDTFSNKENIQDRTIPILQRTALTLSGNHDVVNQADKVGSLKMLDEAFKKLTGAGRCLFADFGQPEAFSWHLKEEGAHVVAIPHVASQALFEASLKRAVNTRMQADATKILLLHCNYDMKEEWATDTSLNLTSARAQDLLARFDYILLGHEHGPADHHDGRVIIVGNLFPTNLGDISDKRIAIFEDGQFRFENIWKMDKGYAEYQCGQIPESVEENFIRVKGEVQVGDMLSLTQSISHMWARSPDLYCVKVDAKVKEIAAINGEEARQSLTQLPAQIRAELGQHPLMLALWNRLLEEEEADK